jgi:hypothetical protein
MDSLPPPTPYGTAISITATAQIPGGELVTASARVIVINPALWRSMPRLVTLYSSKPTAMLNGCLVRRIVGGVTQDGIQTTSGELFPLEGK